MKRNFNDGMFVEPHSSLDYGSNRKILRNLLQTLCDHKEDSDQILANYIREKMSKSSIQYYRDMQKTCILDGIMWGEDGLICCFSWGHAKQKDPELRRTNVFLLTWEQMRNDGLILF